LIDVTVSGATAAEVDNLGAVILSSVRYSYRVLVGIQSLVESAGVFRATPRGDGITQLHQGLEWAVDNPDLHALNHPF